MRVRHEDGFRPASSAGLMSDFGLFPIIQVRSGSMPRSSHQRAVGRRVLLLHDRRVREPDAEAGAVDLELLLLRDGPW